MGLRILIYIFISASILAADENLNEQLFQAAWDSDVARARALIEAGANANYRAENGESVLHHAAIQGNPELISLLLQSGADDESKWSALFRAASNGHPEAVLVLIKAGADVNRQDNDDGGETPLMASIEEGNILVMQALLDAGTKISAVNQTGQTAIQIAAWHGKFDAVQLLKQHGASRKALKEYALLGATKRGETDLVMLLIEQKVDVAIRGEFKRTALMQAVENGYLKIARLLLEGGADVNARDEDQATALLFAAEHNDARMLQLLIRHGAAIGAQDREGANALLRTADSFYASAYSIEAVHVLLDAGIDTALKNKQGKTAAQLFEEKGLHEITNLIRAETRN